MEASFYRPDWLSHWPLVTEVSLQPLLPPKDVRDGVRLKVPTSDHRVFLVTSSTPGHLGTPPKVTTVSTLVCSEGYPMNDKRHSCHSKFQALGNPYQDWEEDQVYISYKSQYHRSIFKLFPRKYTGRQDFWVSHFSKYPYSACTQDW